MSLVLHLFFIFAWFGSLPPFLLNNCNVAKVWGWVAISKYDRGRRVLPSLESKKTNNISDDDEYDNTVIVVGGGVGGLAISARIAAAQRNTKVIILEKNDDVGGRCGSFVSHRSKNGEYRHERGPSLLLLPQVYKDLFQECCNLDNKGSQKSTSEDFGLHMKQCIPAYQVVFEDGDALSVGFPSFLDNDPTSHYGKMMSSANEKMDSYEKDGGKKWNEYMEVTSAFLDCGLPNFIEERLDLPTLPKFVKEALKDNAKSWPLLPHSTVLDATFESSKMKALASFQDLYVGLEPYENKEKLAGGVFSKTAPAVFGLLSALELHSSNDKAGVFAPIGGFQNVTNAFKDLAQYVGVEIHLNKTVTNVNATGVTYTDTNDGSIQYQNSDLTIVNADLPYATKTLLNNNVAEDENPSPSNSVPKFDWDSSFDFSSGVVAFHWSVEKKNLSNNILNTHNVFLIGENDEKARKSWGVVRHNNAPKSCWKEGIFNFYLHCPAATDPTAAPPNCDAITILVPCPTLIRKEEYSDLSKKDAIQKYKEQFTDELIDEIRSSVLKRLSVLDGLENISEYIVHEVVDTPVTYSASYNLGAGTPFGLSHGFNQLSITRPGTQSSMYENVLFVGASSRPGNGVPLVLLGAKLVAKKALKKL